MHIYKNIFDIVGTVYHLVVYTVSEKDNACYHSSTQLSATVWGRSAHIESLEGRKKNFDLLPNFWYIKDSIITSGAQRKIFEKGTIFFGQPVYAVQQGTQCVSMSEFIHDIC